jgi:diguanylate cyclase (GGDEF)-like protein/PAS domain S-box-containing protein
MTSRGISEFSRYLWLTVAMVIVLGITFAVYVRAEKQIGLANESRLNLLFLATELRQSSEDLTRMARTYVVTSTPHYKQQYQEILDIRDGKRPRPSDYEIAYWDLVLPDGPRPRHNGQQAIALMELIRRAGVTRAELAKLEQAKQRSDALTRTEFAAMDLVESPPAFSDARRLRASEMLHDGAYQQAKAQIMGPIIEFYRMTDQRMGDTVHRYQNMARLMLTASIASGLLVLWMLQRTYRALHATLGGSVDKLHQRIARLGSGDFAFDSDMAAPANSVLGWLAETQQNLARTEAVRKEVEAKNQRLTRLYSALSICSQAIIRCRSESELFPEICRAVVTFGGMTMAWIGMLDEAGKQVRPVASFGRGTAYQDNIAVSIDESESVGRGPSGICMREDRAVWCQDFQHDPITAPWHERAAKFGWRASAAVPLHRGGTVAGVMSMYSCEPGAFDEAARNLVVKLAMDIDYALNVFEHERQRHEANVALANSRSLLRTIIDTAPLRIFWKDINLRYLGCNPAFAKDAQMERPQELIGMDDYELVWSPLAERFRSDDRSVLDSGSPRLFYEEPFSNADGEMRWLRTSKVPLRNDRNEIIGLLGIYEDITEQKRAEERIQYLANFDILTGLPSRARLDDLLKNALSIARRNSGHLALMFLDLDHFKDINDALGHSVGDAVLVELSKRLRRAVREEDTIARLGGDEFIVLLPDTDASGAGPVAQKLLDVIVEPYRIAQNALSLTASIGVAIYPDDGANPETLFKSADSAMYHAKQEGRRSYRFSTPAMQARSARNLRLVGAMHEALEHEKFELYFQPQLSLRDGRLIGMEALLRWQHPEFGTVSPSEFIPVAEHSGLILPLGEWALRTAARQARSWLDQACAPIILAVNLSVVQFRSDDLPGMVTRILDEEGLPAEFLDLELTESVAMNDPEHAIEVIYSLHNSGVHVSIDDFGTGYSSLSYLKKLKVHKFKIDQSFVRDLTTDPDDKAIVGAIIKMAKLLGLKTIAEGVETSEQLAYLHEQGCDEIQGFYYSKPLSPVQFAEFLATHR